jgi:hypothetical protein
MTPTEMARRSDSLYMDTKNMHRRQLCDMVAHRETDIEDLRDEAYGLRCDIGRLENENARLRSCLSDDAENARMIMGENARLRDAVRVLVYCGGHVDCDGCPLNGNPNDTHVTVEWFACDALHEMIDKLGVEVEHE